jgi:aryl-alcohol dehydrogenase-like predicted oxidoreductase
LLNKNVSTVILGASNLEQLNDNLKAAEVAPLFTEELKQRLDDL